MSHKASHIKQLLEPELHVIGQVIGGSDFAYDNCFTSLEVKTGKEWVCVGGDEKGQTQVDYPRDAGDMFVWNHPIDLHYYTQTIQGWPQIVFTVGKLDSYGNNSLVGYGFCFIPNTGGIHELEVSVWRPKGTPKEEVFDFFLGGVPHLVNKEMVNNPNKAKEERCRISTIYEGKVHIRLEVMLRNMKPHKIET